MKTDLLLQRLEAVRPRGDRKWTARCPSHADKHPSLSIREGDRGLLVKCWSGCRPEEIMKALGLGMRDLFFDSELPPDRRREIFHKRQVERKQQEDIRSAIDANIDAEREARKLIHSARGIDISEWPDERLHCELDRLADAYVMIEAEVQRG